MLKHAFCALLLLAATASAAHAQVSPAVGEDAPIFGSPRWIANAPEVSDISQLRGDVILIELWGTRCMPCVNNLPAVQRKFEQYGNGKGLHLFAFEVQGSPEENIRALISARGLTFPIAAGSPTGYRGSGGIPMAWLIGVDGKVVFAGNPLRGLDAALTAEMAKCRYPGLGLTEVHRDADRAAQEYVRGNYAGARQQANRIIERGERANPQAVEHAQHILDRINSIVEGRFARAESLEGERRYLDAYEIYQSISTQFRREEEGNRADARIREMDADREGIRREMDADRALRNLQSQLSGNANPAQFLPALRSFQDRFEGTRAAEDVQRMMDEMGSRR